MGSGATLRFVSGIYGVDSLGGSGSSVVDGADVVADDVSVATGGQLRMLSGALSSKGSLSNAGTIVASGGLLDAGDIDNAAGAGFTIAGAAVTAGPLVNAGTTTLQAGSLSVDELVNTGTLNLNGGTFTRSAGSPFSNSGTVHLRSGTLSLAGGDGGAADGVYDVQSGGTLQFNAGNYALRSLGGGGSIEIGGGTVAAAGLTLAGGGQLRLLAGVLSSAGALDSAGTISATGGSLNTNGLINRGGGHLTIDGSAASVGPFVNAGVATLQSGSLSVGAVSNTGTLNLNGGTVTRPAGAFFSNSGRVNVNNLTLVLDAGDGGTGGGSYGAGSGATVRFTGGDYNVSSFGGTGSAEIDGANVTAANVSVDAGTHLLLRSGALSSQGALSNAGTVVASGGLLNASSINNASGSVFTVDGATVTTGPFSNAGTATLQSGSLTVNSMSNSGTLNLNGGTLNRDTGMAFGNTGAVHLLNTTISLDDGDGGAGGGSYDVGNGAILQLNRGDYTMSSLGIGGAGRLTIGGAKVSAGSLTNAGIATLQSGELSVGAVVNSGTLNLNGATLTRTPRAIFDNNLGTVNLSTGTLSLDGGDGRNPNAPQIPGGDYNLASGTRLEFTGGRYGVRSIVGEGATVAVEGVVSPAKLYSSSPMTISVQTLTVQAGSYFASIDPPDLTLDIPGGLSLIGGSTDGAYAQIQGGNVSITTSNLTLVGGAGNNSFAAIEAMTGGSNIIASDQINMVPGGGASSGAWMSATAALTVSAVSCNGCTLLSDNPSQSTTSAAGLFGNPVSLSLSAEFLQVPSSVLVGVQTAQTGGEGDAILSKEEEEEKENEQSSDEARAKEELKNEKPRQVCM